MAIPTRFLLILGSAALLTTSAARAQDEADSPRELAVQNKYRIGLACGEVSEALRMHLRLPDDSGLLVNAVMDDSPAGRAGLKRFDVIVTANGKPVATALDLVRVVNEVQANSMDLAIIRRGEHQVVAVTPEERPADEVTEIPLVPRQTPGFGLDNLPPELRRHLDQFEEFGTPGGRGFNLRRFLPGIIVDDPNWRRGALPNNFSLQIEKAEEGPAKIKVRRGDEEWNVTEDNLDELPPDVRPLVENALNGSRGQLFGLMAPELDSDRPSEPRRPRSDRTPELNRRFDGLELQLKELQDAIRAMQEDRN